MKTRTTQIAALAPGEYVAKRTFTADNGKSPSSGVSEGRKLTLKQIDPLGYAHFTADGEEYKCPADRFRVSTKKADAEQRAAVLHGVNPGSNAMKIIQADSPAGVLAAPVMDEGKKNMLRALSESNLLGICRHNGSAAQALYQALADNMTMDDLDELLRKVEKIGREGDPADARR